MQKLDPLKIPLHGIRLIEASAGTGKTYTIANLYLRLLVQRRLRVDQILVVTFTRAATEELRGRIRQRIQQALGLLRGGVPGDEFLAALLQDRPEDTEAWLFAALTSLDEAVILTIHSFCLRLLQEQAFESGASFDNSLVRDEKEVLREVAEDFWRREFYRASPGLAALVRRNWAGPEALLDAVSPYLRFQQLRVIPEPNVSAISETAYQLKLSAIESIWRGEEQSVRHLLCDKKNPLSKGPYQEAGVIAAAERLSAYLDREGDDYFLPEGFELFTSNKLENSLKPAKRSAGERPPQHPFFDLCQELIDLCDQKVNQIYCAALAYCRDESRTRRLARHTFSYDDLISQLHSAVTSRSGIDLGRIIREQFPVAMIDEFQDTDPLQYALFREVYRHPGDYGLLLIGDPKQAIYSFRGGDIFTYIAARNDTDGAAGRFNLATNWRSSEGLIGAVNTLFSNADAPFLFAGQIDYHEVKPSLNANAEVFAINKHSPPPLMVWFVDGGGSKSGRGALTKSVAKEMIAAACAGEIERLLAGAATVGERRLQSGDIAILVRTHSEAAIIKQALSARGIGSVYLNRESVFRTLEAEELARLLQGIADPGEHNHLRAALATEIGGYRAHQLVDLDNDERLSAEVLQRFYEYQTLWKQRSFIAMFQILIKQESIAERLVGLSDGERRLTNLLHLGELLQAASLGCHGIPDLLRWFAEQRLDADGDNEEQQLRLESDESLVKIVTIHKSKGLEYPLVLLPYTWSARQPKKTLFHQPESGQLCLDLGSDNCSNHHELAERETLAEDLRLLYVALTRAKSRCYLAFGNIKGFENSAPAYLLCQHPEDKQDIALMRARVKDMDDTGLRQAAEVFAAASGGTVEVANLPEDYLSASGVSKPIAPSYSAHELQVRSVDARFDRSWKTTSYSALMFDSPSAPEQPDFDQKTFVPVTPGFPQSSESNDLIDFPRGAKAGRFFHELMENLDFPKASGKSLSDASEGCLTKYGFNPSVWQAVIERAVEEVLDTSLDPAVDLKLRRVTSRQRLVEMQFFFPLAMIDTHDFEPIVAADGRDRSNAPPLKRSHLKGLMQGFIDLIFEFQGKFYLLDYKTNFLGERLSDYAEEKLWAEIVSHRYDLQYLIYTVALHRYLSQRLKHYDYERDFGGVYYLFVRGMRAANRDSCGVFYDKPNSAVVRELDRWFAQGLEPNLPRNR